MIGPFVVVPRHEGIEVGLDLIQGPVELSAEGDLVELFLNGLVQALDSAVGLRMPDSDPRMLDIVEMKKELIGVALGTTAVFSAVVA